VTLFFENLKTCYERNKFPPEICFNMDETDISTVPASVPKVVTTKEKRSVCKVTSGEKGQTVTAVCCMSASGLYVPPAKKVDSGYPLNFLSNAPTSTLALVTESGFMNSDQFRTWLQHFARHVKPTKHEPVLLISDNHDSHCTLAAVVL
jgi:hypothetical protein